MPAVFPGAKVPTMSTEVTPAAAISPALSRVLVTGATGYIGGRLVPRLLARGLPVRCAARDIHRLEGYNWPGVELVAGDLEDPVATAKALAGIDVAYYLVHSMAAGHAFRERDRHMALGFGEAAAKAGVKRIIYLGGLGDPEKVHSKHLVSRQEVGRCLSACGVPVIEFRAAVIVGSGSASFEIIRHLVELLPVMIAPTWVNTRCQPIGIRSVLEYLEESLDHPSANGIYEIGGADILSYRDMMVQYAQIRGLRRFIYSFPVPWPQLSSRWIDLLTPVPHRIVQPLVESLRTEVVVRDNRARETFRVAPTGYSEAVRRALTRLAIDYIETTWASSLSSLTQDQPESDLLDSHEGMLLDRRRRRTTASPERVFEAICSLGGRARLAGRQLPLATARDDGPFSRWSGHAPRPPPSPGIARGRSARLLARGSPGGAAFAAPPRGDEATGPGLAAIRGAAGTGRRAGGADGLLRASRRPWLPLLVFGPAVPSFRVPRAHQCAQATGRGVGPCSLPAEGKIKAGGGQVGRNESCQRGTRGQESRHARHTYP